MTQRGNIKAYLGDSDLALNITLRSLTLRLKTQ